MSIIRTLAKSSTLNVIQTLVSIVVGLYMMPFLISRLGESNYGLWILIGSLTSSLYIFDMGFAEAITRFVGDSLNRKEYHLTNKVISTSMLIYCTLAALIIVATVIIAYVSQYFVTQKDNIGLIRLLVIMTGVNVALEFPFKSFSGIAVSQLRYDLLAISRIATKLLSAVLIVYFISSGYGLIALSLITLVSSQVGNVLYFGIAKYLFQEMHVSRLYIDYGLLKEILNFSKWTFLIDLSKIIKDRIDIYMVAAFLSTSILTTYYVALRLTEYSLELLTRTTNFTTPLFIKYHAQHEMSEIDEKVKIFTRVNFILSAYAIIYYFCYGDDIIRLWMGSSFDTETAYMILLILLSGRLACFVFTPSGSVFIACSKPKTNSIIGVVECFLSAALIFLFVKILKLGPIGASLGLSAPFFITRVMLTPILAYRLLAKSPLFLYMHLLKPFVLALIIGGISKIGTDMIVTSSITGLIISTIIFGFVTLFAGIISLSNVEREMLKKILPQRYRLKFTTN